MKKIFTFCNLNSKKRLFGLLSLFLLCTNAFSQSVCRPVSHTTGQGGLVCLGLDINSPASAYDNDAGLATYATLTNAVGVGCFVQETFTLNQTAKAGDQIVLYLGTGNGLLDVGLLSNATLQAKFSGTNVGSSVALNSPLLNLNLLSSSIATVRFTVTADTNQIQLQVGGLVSLLVSLRIYDVRLDFAKPTVTGGLTQTICSGSSTTLTATPVAGTTLSWYTTATSTTPLITANSYQTPVLTTATTYYIGVTRAAGCEGSERLPVVVNVSNPVAPVISTSGTAICSAGATQQTTLSVINPILGTTYNWYSVNSGGTILASGDTYSPVVSVGTTNFFVEAAIGSCVSPARTQVVVISNPIPVAPTVLTQSVTIQSGQNATLSASATGTGVTLNWYDVATGGTVLATNTETFITPILVASKTYYVEAQSASGGCVSSSRVPVVVTVVNNPLGTCLEANSQQTNFNGLCLLCGSTNPNNSVDGNPATAARLTIPVGLVNGYAQQTLQFNNPGRAGDIVDVELEVPGGLLDLSVLNYISLATYNGATFNNDRVSINNIVDIVLLGGNRFRASVVAGAAFDRVEVRLGGLLSAITSLDIYQAAYRYKAPAVAGNKLICSGQSTTLTATLGAGETVEWYSTAVGGSPLANTASYTTLNLNTATTYYLAITRNGCLNSERSSVEVLIDNPIAPVVSAVPLSICSGQTSTITIQAPVTGTVYKWYDAASAGNLLFTGNSFVTPNLTANTSYFIEAGINSCISASRTQVDITVNPLPAAPIAASSNVIIQSGQSVTLQVSSPEPNVAFDWYDAAVNGTLIATATPTYVTPVLTANKTYYVTARNTISGCTSTSRTPINVVVSASISTCLQAISQNITQGGTTACLFCSSNNDGNASDGNVATASTLTIPVGLLGDHIEQTLTFSSAGQTGDIIDVELGVPTGLLDISALSNINLSSFNLGVPNGDQVSISSILNIQLLGGNRFKVSFTAGGPFTSVQIQLNGVVSVLTSLNIYDASFRYKNATVTGASLPICSGQNTTLTASTTATGETYKWYDAAIGGTELSALPSYTTPGLTVSTTYYLEATRGTCINTVREPITVTVSPFATAADITITSPQEASCAGGVVLSPTSGLVGAQFKYYGDQAKTIPILNGGVGLGGETYTIDPTTYALTVSGLTSVGSPYSYFVSVINAGNCENAAGTLKEVTVTYPTVTNLTVIATPLVGCGSANLRNAITGFDTTGNTTYTFYDALNNSIPENAAGNITASGVYSIQAQGNGITCPSVIRQVTVTVNPLPSLVVNPSVSVNAGSTVTLSATSDGTLAWFDPQGNTITGPPYTTGVLNTPGIYTYTVVASNANCSVTGTVSVNVIDPGACQSLTERVYATGQTQGNIVTGVVTNPTAAVDGNPQTFSTITTGVGLLGLGTTWQSLTWPANIVKGTPVTIKLGSEDSVLAVGQNLSIIGTKSGVDIGEMQSVSGSLLNLISGENSFEYTFVPSNTSGPQDYDGIRIQSASILGVAQNTKVFDAYYYTPVTTPTCTPGDIQDIFYGATDLGLPVGAVTTTVGVSDSWNVADNDITTFATMYNGIGVLAAADLTVAFKTPSIVSDTLRIVVSKPGVLLDVNLLAGFSVQRYLGNVAVGAPIQNTSTLLSIRVLPGNTISIAIVSSLPEPYDRVRIRLGGVVGVLESLRVHTVERTANTQVIGGDLNNKVIVCPGSPVTLQIPAEACSTYIWYDSPLGNTVVANGITYTVPATLAAGIYKYYVQPVRYGCPALARGEVTVEVKASSPVNALTDITLNGGTTTSICSTTGTITLATSLSGTPVLTNPIYYWYSFDGATSQLIPGETTPQLIVNGLTPGTYTYYVGVSSTEFCETAAADRKQITLTILPPSGVNDISVADISVCHSVPAVLTPIAATLTNPVFTWYFDANKTQPITNGLVVSGVTYAISATGILTVTGLTRAASPVTYFVAVSSDTTCENIAGTLPSATIIVNDPATPTTTDTTQDFCLIDAPTFASIQVNETNVVWYTAATGGIAIPLTTGLTSGTYYAALLDAVTGCESSVRLLVTISVTDPATPTTTDTTQDFCLVNAPTFASIQTNQPNVVWYAAATGGTAIPATTALTSGTYYAALLDAVTGCESSVRLLVTISVTDPATPTTTDTTQDFCLVNAPTFASIQRNQPNVVWYVAATGGTAITPTTALTSGTYYAALLDAVTGCESSIRLAVTISVTDPATPTTTDTTQDFCLVNAPTFASIQTNQPNVVWYVAATGGTAITPTTALTSGTYYAALLDAVTGCESSIRLAVTISVTDPATPTTTDTTQDFCLVNAPTFASIQTNQPNVVWYAAATGGTAIPATTALTSGTYYAALLDATTGCESSIRLAVTISVTDPATPTTTDTTQDFCLVNAPTFASIQTNQPNVVWYAAATGGTAIPATTALTSGTYYAALLDAVTGCESSVRLLVTISVTDPATPTTSDTTQDFCLIDAPTFASIQTNQPNVVWYSAATGGTAITPTTALTGGTYYATLLDAATGCESSVRLLVTISVTDPATPTTTDTTQDFCLVNAPTFASIQTNQPNVVWYAAATGGTAIPGTTALTSGTYYAALLDAVTGCESSIRLAVTISVTDPATPTTTDTTQDFCLVDAPTFASIQTNQPNVVWYSAATGGTAIPATTALTSGTYYAALLDAVTGCESSVRLLVTISVTDPATPTTTDTTQDFCLVNAPTFASIQTNQPNVVWYAAATDGTAIPATTALTSGTYYAALLDAATGCQSSVRLLVTISVTDPATPTTTDTTQDFCLVNAPTFASIQTNQPNVVWYVAATGGTAIPATTALTTGTYYAALLDAATGCESSVRLLVTISVTDPATPTTTDNTQDFCLVNAPTFASIQTNQPNVVWYSAATGGTAIPATTALTSGTYYAALLDAATGCQSSVRLLVTISVTDPATPTTTDTTQDFCLVNAPTFASIQTNQPNVVWYVAATGGTAIPATTALTSGTYYAALLDAATGCESSVRLLVTISVTDPATPTTTDTTQDFCLVNAPTFASIQTNQPNVVWYAAATGGTAIPATTALTSGTYYAALLDAATGCESSVRLLVTISVTDPATPTTTDTTQDFCLVNAPTFASIQTNQPNVVWYAAATGGTAIPATTALTSGTYYAALLDAATGCESSVRLLVTISVTDPATPTTTDTTQDFCLVNAPTFASIQTNQPNVVWYSAATGGTAIPGTTALTSGTYYAALLDAVTGCESSVRLLVTISVTDPATPTTTDTTQDFCLVNAPTFASIQTNQPNVVWYAAATGGTAIPATTALTSGTYYAALLDAVTGCESSVRLLVTISVTDPATPTTTDTTQDFCLIDAPTFASIQTNQPNVVWYSAATGGIAIPATTALTSGTYYAALLDAATGCESSIRLAVTISVTDPATPTTTDTTQDFCLVDAPTFASIQTNQPNVVWYSAATGGTAIPATTALTSGTYYAALLDATTGCESSVRLLVTISVTNPATPTTTDDTQSFCITDVPTVADIQVNEGNVVWYSTSTGGTVIASTTPLVNGIYYGAILNPTTGCESVSRLQVTITIENPTATPTTNSSTQNFCSVNAPTVANIQVNEGNVVWYSTSTGGTAIPATTALATGTYYGAIASSVGCENPVRLVVVVNVNTPGIITTPRTTQTFCLSDTPTVADILVNEPNVVWYSSSTGGTPLAANAPLTAGTYYATALNNTTNGCVNTSRLGIKIEFENDALVQLTTTDDTPCVFQGVTYSIANGKSNYVWSITNGTILTGGGTADGSVTVSWSDIGPGTVSVTYVNTCDETTTKSLNVTIASCSDLTITNTVNNPTPNFGDEVVFTITVNNVGQGTIINTLVSELIPSGYSLVSFTTSTGVYDPATQVWTIPTLNAGESETLEVKLLVLPSGNYNNVATIEISTPLDVDPTNNSATAFVEPICLTVYNEFTPNNDGQNDLFRIDCIETHPNNELKVFNRYGALVYSKKNYANDWDGTSNVSGVINRGDMLPTGTYFYLIDTGDGTVKKGWLSIMR